LIIGKFDATANEVADLQVRGFPTLRLYTKENKGGIDFEGERTLETLKIWI